MARQKKTEPEKAALFQADNLSIAWAAHYGSPRGECVVSCAYHLPTLPATTCEINTVFPPAFVERHNLARMGSTHRRRARTQDIRVYDEQGHLLFSWTRTRPWITVTVATRYF